MRISVTIKYNFDGTKTLPVIASVLSIIAATLTIVIALSGAAEPSKANTEQHHASPQPSFHLAGKRTPG